MRIAIGFLCFCVASGGILRGACAQDTIFVPPANRIAIRAMRSVPIVDVDPSLHVHTVIGATGSVSLVDFDSGGVAPLHHHTREQVDVGLSDSLRATIGSHAEVLAAGDGVLLPADVAHAFVNAGPRVATMIEFHTVRRFDVVPPRPRLTFPVSAEATTVPDSERMIARMDTPAGKTFAGRTCTVRWRLLSFDSDVHPQPTPTELYIYVARGAAELTTEGRTTNVPQGSLIIIPGDAVHVRLNAPRGSTAALIEFQVDKP